MTHHTFPDLSVRITPATPEQAAAIRAIFAHRMASVLIAGDGIELRDEAACASRLAACGFGDRLVTALLPDAQALAAEQMTG